MPIILIILVVALLIAFFEFAAVRWGHDSRDNFRFNRDGRFLPPLTR